MWRRFEPWHRGVLLVSGAIARLLVLLLSHRVAVARVLCPRARVHQYYGDPDRSIPVVVQVVHLEGDLVQAYAAEDQ